MDLGLKDKVAIVTGSSRGIGLGVATLLQQEGCQVVLNGRNQAVLQEARAILGNEVLSCVADVSKLTDCQRVIAETIKAYGQIDVLVCNVGLSRSVPPGQETQSTWEAMFTSNFFPAVNMIESARPYLREQQGNIVCISSICGQEVIPGAPATYATAKAALNMAVKSLSKPLGAQGIRINAVAPGNVLFPGSVWDKKMQQDAATVKTMLEREVALQRLGTPAEIADTVAFLASPKSAFTTGSIVVVDGGQVHN